MASQPRRQPIKVGCANQQPFALVRACIYARKEDPYMRGCVTHKAVCLCRTTHRTQVGEACTWNKLCAQDVLAWRESHVHGRIVHVLRERSKGTCVPRAMENHAYNVRAWAVCTPVDWRTAWLAWLVWSYSNWSKFRLFSYIFHVFFYENHKG